MTEMLDAVNIVMEEASPTVEELELARDLVRQAKVQGASMSAPGLMRALTRSVLETALDEELAEHLGYDKHDPAGYNTEGNQRVSEATPVGSATAFGRASPASAVAGPRLQTHRPRLRARRPLPARRTRLAAQQLLERFEQHARVAGIRIADPSDQRDPLS